MSYTALPAEQCLPSITVLMVFIFNSGVYMNMCVYAKGNGSTKHLRGYLISYASLSPPSHRGSHTVFFCYDLHSRVNQVLPRQLFIFNHL